MSTIVVIIAALALSLVVGVAFTLWLLFRRNQPREPTYDELCEDLAAVFHQMARQIGNELLPSMEAARRACERLARTRP